MYRSKFKGKVGIFLILTLTLFLSSINLDLIFSQRARGEEINSAISSQTNDNELSGKPTQVNVQVNLDKDSQYWGQVFSLLLILYLSLRCQSPYILS